MTDNIDLKLFRVWNNATKTLFRNLFKDIKTYNISNENFMVLELLFHKGPHTVQNISEILMIPSGSITYVVNQLEKEGYVKREPCQKDKRRSFVHLESKGQEFFSNIFPQHELAISKNFDVLSDEEKETLYGLLKKVGLDGEGRND